MDVTTLLQQGLQLHQAGRLDEAQRIYTHVLASDADNAEALHLLALIDFRQGRRNRALEQIGRSLTLRPSPQAFNNHGLMLAALGRHGEAVESFNHACNLDPSNADAHVNHSTSLVEVGRYTEALEACTQAIRLRAACAAAYRNRAAALDGLGRIQEAIPSFVTARLYDPTLELMEGLELNARMRICQWDGLEEIIASILQRFDAGECASPPAQLLPIPMTPAQQKQTAETFCSREINVLATPQFPRPRAPGKIRLGYFSPDFTNHPVSYLAAGLFETHDRAKFEVFGFSLARGKPDEMRGRLSRAFDKLIDVQDNSDEETAALARSFGIDIAIDLAGHTTGSRMGIFAHRTAPIQCSYLGYPATMGLPSIDYMFADDVLIPSEQRVHYTEKIAYLPSYQVNDLSRPWPAHTFSRRDLGLPEDGIVFCGFNSAYKFTPDLFDIWMRLLRRLDRSVLWLRESAAMANLTAEAERRGVSSDRLVFAPSVSMEDHLARHRCADLFLDTFYYGAHTTASDALWMGLPVLTTPGQTFASRVAASLLTALDLPELIAPSREAYEATALELATNPAKLQVLKHRLEANRTTSVLFDTARFARDIEAAYQRMMAIHERGGAPEHFSV